MSTRVQGHLDVPTQTVRLYVLDCPRCGVVFAITQEYENRRRADARTFHCPNGHDMSWSQSEADRLRDQLAREQKVSAEARRRAQEERDARKHAEKVAQGYKGQMVRTKNRIGKGVCPCCNRHFANVERHMSSQHPEYAAGTA